MITTVVTWITVIALSLTVACALYRVIVGPTILDRMIASDVVLTTLLIALAAEMVLNGHTRSIPAMVVIAASASFATITVARSVGRSALGRKEHD
jgi:multicomponent Na+:H+ antiporter subunit F